MEHNAAKATPKDLADGAREHYEKIAGQACEHNSLIPKAIDAWQELEERKGMAVEGRNCKEPKKALEWNEDAPNPVACPNWNAFTGMSGLERDKVLRQELDAQGAEFREQLGYLLARDARLRERVGALEKELELTQGSIHKALLSFERDYQKIKKQVDSQPKTAFQLQIEQEEARLRAIQAGVITPDGKLADAVGVIEWNKRQVPRESEPECQSMMPGSCGNCLYRAVHGCEKYNKRVDSSPKKRFVIAPPAGAQFTPCRYDMKLPDDFGEVDELSGEPTITVTCDNEYVQDDPSVVFDKNKRPLEHGQRIHLYAGVDPGSYVPGNIVIDGTVLGVRPARVTYRLDSGIEDSIPASLCEIIDTREPLDGADTNFDPVNMPDRIICNGVKYERVEEPVTSCGDPNCKECGGQEPTVTDKNGREIKRGSVVSGKWCITGKSIGFDSTHVLVQTENGYRYWLKPDTLEVIDPQPEPKSPLESLFKAFGFWPGPLGGAGEPEPQPIGKSDSNGIPLYKGDVVDTRYGGECIVSHWDGTWIQMEPKVPGDKLNGWMQRNVTLLSCAQGSPSREERLKAESQPVSNDEPVYPCPRDLIRVSLGNGVELLWEVSAVYLGGLREESVVELVPVGQTPNSYGKTLIPAQLLDCAIATGAVILYAGPNNPNYRKDGA
jgi:hypothetical protein